MIAEAIASYMEEHHITQTYLCQKTGLSRYCISYALKGKRRFRIEEYEKICFALQVSYEYFFRKDKKSA